ncbi:RICIN domain-containing protein [Actinoplanes friuliensis]|uniref:Ricin n=1 Tax=Actinoplanes friuliensis DSM 7358 TaxID=1246995 RepID=U5VZ69_9ACTN|nr:RICIN domain-containing protein [Actinoplanes friuliensis]AGZ42042.1 Ricin [Actinoplanes friuliensis DSM 7358]
MADEDLERNDPVLVRPYITTEPGSAPGGHDDRPLETWPEEALLPSEDNSAAPAATVEPPAVAGPAAKTSALLRQRLMVLSGLGILAVLIGAGLLVFGTSEDQPPPQAARPTAPAPGPNGSLGAAPVASVAGRSIAPTSRATSRPAAPGRTTSGAPAAGAPAPQQPGTPTGTPPPAATTLEPPPAQARTGAITAASGRCLVLGGLLALDGSPVQTASCSGMSYQEFTVETDGTLRVTNRCAQTDDDGTVHIRACGEQPAQQWRAGPEGSLVNPGTGQCLTDPGNAGATVTLAACTGADNQRWTLP